MSAAAELLDRCREQLLAHEGLRLRPYRCSAGKLTIGVGRNLDDRGISRDEAMLMLEHDLAAVVAELDTRVAWWAGLATARQAVLVDMCFQLGLTGLLRFERFLAAAREGRHADAEREMLASRWATQAPVRARRLAEQWRTGRAVALPAPSIEGS